MLSILSKGDLKEVEIALNKLGISIKNANNEFKTFNEVLNEISEKYSEVFKV